MHSKNLKKIVFLLTARERYHAALLFILVVVMALFEMAGIASIMPFIAVLSNPEIIDTNLLLNKIFQNLSYLGLKTKADFLFTLGLFFLILLIFSIFLKALTTYFLLHFCKMREHSIGSRFVEGYLQKSYSWFLDRNSSDLGKNILSEVKVVIDNGIKPLLTLISQSVVAIVIIILLIVVNPEIALIMSCVLSFTYIFIYKLVKNFLNKSGEERFIANHERFKIVLEAFEAIKILKVSNLEQKYFRRFSNFSYLHAKKQSSAQIVSVMPRFLLEGITFGGMLIVILYAIVNNNNFDDFIPKLALYVFAGYRLLPALQQIYSSVAELRFVSSSLDYVCDELKNLKKFETKHSQNLIQFEKSIELKNIDYSYPNSSGINLSNINIHISAFSKIGLVGVSGSGKTTLVDIILGLLIADRGQILVDGHLIDKEKISEWRNLIGYVPQDIYLADDTISANIAFGANKENIDQLAIERAAKTAKLHDFITNELPLKYHTNVGERGVRLSGGQRQRIGIARALYHNPKILIFDEATSALDNITEKKIMETLYSMNKNITIIIIAHRFETVKKCDYIYLLEKGEIKAKGKYNILSKKNKKFQDIEKGNF